MIRSPDGKSIRKLNRLKVPSGTQVPRIFLDATHLPSSGRSLARGGANTIFQLLILVDVGACFDFGDLKL